MSLKNQKMCFIFFCFIFVCFGICSADEFLFIPRIEGINLREGQPDEVVKGVDYERYQAGWNLFKEESLFLEDDDFRIGKVKTIFYLEPSNPSELVYLRYLADCTEVEIGEMKKEIYYFDDQNLLKVVKTYQRDESGVFFLHQQEHFIWKNDLSTPRLISRAIEDKDGQTIFCRCFYYNEQGQLTKEMIAGNLSGDCFIPCIIEADGYPRMNGIETYSTEYFYSDKNADIPEVAIDDDGLEIPIHVDNHRARDQKSANCFKQCIEYLQGLQQSIYYGNRQWEMDFRLPASFESVLDQFNRNFFGNFTYLLLGSHFKTIQIGTFGQHEINDKVRISFINGILNTRDMMVESLRAISETHGGIKVHNVFRATEGWTRDISQAIMIKAMYQLGFYSRYAYLLVDKWRELIEEVGGVGSDGVIIHYAHSLGGSDTDRARDMLTSEEQKMIRVVTFGSPTLIRNEGYQSVVNITSTKDALRYLDPLGNIRNYLDPNSNVEYYVPSTRWIFPGDHVLSGDTYRTVIRALGEKFLAEFQ